MCHGSVDAIWDVHVNHRCARDFAGNRTINGLGVLKHPGVLGAAALTGVHDQAPLGQRHPAQATGEHVDIGAVIDGERTQVDMAWPDHPVLHHRGVGGEAHNRLGDP